LQLIIGWRSVVNARDAFTRLAQGLQDHPPTPVDAEPV